VIGFKLRLFYFRERSHLYQSVRSDTLKKKKEIRRKIEVLSQNADLNASLYIHIFAHFVFDALANLVAHLKKIGID